MNKTENETSEKATLTLTDYEYYCVYVLGTACRAEVRS